MRSVRTSLGVGAAVFALVMVANSFAAAPPSKHHHHQITGKVIEIDHGKKGHGVIKVEVHEHHGKTPIKSEARTKHHVISVHVNHDTRFEKVSHTGNGTREVIAHFRDLEPGMHVRLELDHAHHAQEVSILLEHHKNKK